MREREKERERETSCSRDSSAFVPKGPEHYTFGNQFNSKNAKKLRFHVFLMLGNIWYHNFAWSRLDSQEIVSFVPNLDRWGLKLNTNKIQNFLQIQSTSGKIMIFILSHGNWETHGIWAFWQFSSTTGWQNWGLGPREPISCICGLK